MPLTRFSIPRHDKAVAGDIVRIDCGCLFDVLDTHDQSVSSSLRAICDRHYGTYLGESPWYLGHGNYEVLDPLTVALLMETNAH